MEQKVVNAVGFNTAVGAIGDNALNSNTTRI